MYSSPILWGKGIKKKLMQRKGRTGLVLLCYHDKNYEIITINGSFNLLSWTEVVKIETKHVIYEMNKLIHSLKKEEYLYTRINHLSHTISVTYKESNQLINL